MLIILPRLVIMIITVIVIVIITVIVIVMRNNSKEDQFQIIEGDLENGYWLFADLPIKRDQGRVMILHIQICANYVVHFVWENLHSFVPKY